MLQLTVKTQADYKKQSAASNKAHPLGGPAPYGPGIPTGMPFAAIQLPLSPAWVLRPAFAYSRDTARGALSLARTFSLRWRRPPTSAKQSVKTHTSPPTPAKEPPATVPTARSTWRGHYGLQLQAWVYGTDSELNSE